MALSGADQKKLYRPPGHDNYTGGLLFWPEKGSVVVVDMRYPEESNKSAKILSVREWLLNLRALNMELSLIPYGDERRALERLVEEGIRVARIARSQGDPNDPKHVEEMLLRRRKEMLTAQSSPGEGALSAKVAPEGKLLADVED